MMCPDPTAKNPPVDAFVFAPRAGVATIVF
jgi:hypothetical protein